MPKDTLTDHLKKHRQTLHQIPEIAFDLFKTHAYIKNELESYGYETETVAKTGLIAIKKGNSKETIAFRSDMDALNVLEKTDVSFQSTHVGKMHACGHDGHMSMLLGFAQMVSEKSDLTKNIMFVFQPAEEGPGGAKHIIEAGVFEKHNVKAIFGIHLYPDLEEGLIGLVDGPMMAQNGEFDVTIQGQSAHGAQPHKGHDAIVATAQLVTQYQNIVSRFLNPLIPAVVTVGTINGGEARNIIAQTVKLSGTIRTFDPTIYQQIKTSLANINQSIEVGFNVDVDMDLRDYYPPVINDHNLFEHVKSILEPNTYQMIPPMMFAEDFAFYQQVMPGFFMMLGTRNETLGYTHPLHSCYFNFKEDVLIKGVNLYDKIARSLNIYQ
ncbi:MAG: M20 metallopeptidase family protein [Acholeplasmataceae bacterium]